MVVTRALYKAASLPLRAAASAVNTSAAIVGGSVQFGTTATGAAVGAGMRLASAPARGMADLLSGLSEIHSLAGLAAEFVGAEPVRRSTRSGDRAWIEVRGLQHPQHGAAVADDVLTAVRAHPNVRAAQVNCPLSRVMVTRDGDAPSIQELCRIVADAERQHPGAATDERPLDLPGDSEVLAGRLVALAATSAGLAAALGGKALPWPRLPIGAAAAVTIVDYEPRVRRLLEQRFGPIVTDTALGVATAAVYTATQAWASLAVDLLVLLSKAAESRSAQKAWAHHEPTLAAHAGCADTHLDRGPRRCRPGAVERHGDRSGLAEIAGAAAAGSLTRDVNAAATAAVVTAPKAVRNAREGFAATLGRGLADGYGVVTLDSGALRRLDRVDAVVVDPRVLLATDTCRSTGSAADLPAAERAAWLWAQEQIDRGRRAGSGWDRMHPGATATATGASRCSSGLPMRRWRGACWQKSAAPAPRWCRWMSRNSVSCARRSTSCTRGAPRRTPRWPAPSRNCNATRTPWRSFPPLRRARWTPPMSQSG